MAKNRASRILLSAQPFLISCGLRCGHWLADRRRPEKRARRSPADVVVAASFAPVPMHREHLPGGSSCEGRRQFRVQSRHSRREDAVLYGSQNGRYLLSWSAAVLGSSNVSTPKPRELHLNSPALKPAAPEDGRTPLNRYDGRRYSRKPALNTHAAGVVHGKRVAVLMLGLVTTAFLLNGARLGHAEEGSHWRIYPLTAVRSGTFAVAVTVSPP